MAELALTISNNHLLNSLTHSDAKLKFPKATHDNKHVKQLRGVESLFFL
jgi:hypothetical protein